jgi:hypothetical protein
VEMAKMAIVHCNTAWHFGIALAYEKKIKKISEYIKNIYCDDI